MKRTFSRSGNMSQKKFIGEEVVESSRYSKKLKIKEDDHHGGDEGIVISAEDLLNLYSINNNENVKGSKDGMDVVELDAFTHDPETEKSGYALAVAKDVVHTTKRTQDKKDKLELQIVVTKTSFARPDNFIKRSGRKGEATDITDPEGAWMNAGVGGDNNTLDIYFQLENVSTGEVFRPNINIPVKVKLFGIENGQVIGEQLDEVRQNYPVDKSGHRRSNNFLVSGKSSCEMCLTSSGTGILSIKITTTSHLNNRRKFAIEVLPDVELFQQNQYSKSGKDLELKKKLAPVLANVKHVTANDEVTSHTSLSFPVEVMSKINKLAEKREQVCEFSQTKHYLNKAFESLKTGIEKLGPNHSEIPKLIQQLNIISAYITANNSNLSSAHNEETSANQKSNLMSRYNSLFGNPLKILDNDFDFSTYERQMKHEIFGNNSNNSNNNANHCNTLDKIGSENKHLGYRAQSFVSNPAADIDFLYKIFHSELNEKRL